MPSSFRTQRLDQHELQLRLQKIERRFENMERHGEVSDVKYDKENKRWMVKFNDGDDKKPSGEGESKSGDTFKTDWRPWQSFSHGTISMSVPPKKGMKCTFRSPGGYPEQGYTIPYHNGPDTPSPHDKPDEVVFQIRKPKKDKDESKGSSSSGSGSGSGSSGSSGSGSSQGGDDEDQNDDAIRISTNKSGYTLTVGKIGKGQDASATDGDGQTAKDKNTFQMKISRDAKTITCGKFKATLGKDGAKMAWGDKVSFELKDGQIESIVNGAKNTITKDKITTDVDGTKLTTSAASNKFEGGKVQHEDRNIGKDHVHKGVTPGGGKTQDPDV